MKSFFSKTALLILVWLFSYFQLLAQGDLIESAKVAIKNANSKELAKNFNQSVDIGFDGEKANYSKTQAEFVVRDFFKKTPPSNFEVNHRGESKEGLKYAIGKYTSQNGSYRVTMYIKLVGGVYLIDSLDFSKE